MPAPTLAARKTALDVNLLTFAGTNWLGSYKTYTHNFDLNTQDAKSTSGRYSFAQPTKRKQSFNLNIMQDKDGSHRGTNLDLTAWNVAGTSRIGVLKHATVTITTKVASTEGSGAKDFDEYPIPVGTDMEIQASEFVSSSADLIALGAQTGSVLNFEMAMLITVAGLTFSATMLLSAGSLKIESEQIQMQDCTWKLRGVITSPSGTPTYEGQLFALIATGVAQVQYSVDTGTMTQVGYALMTKATMSMQDNQIITNDFEFQNQGAPAAS